MVDARPGSDSRRGGTVGMGTGHCLVSARVTGWVLRAAVVLGAAAVGFCDGSATGTAGKDDHHHSQQGDCQNRWDLPGHQRPVGI